MQETYKVLLSSLTVNEQGHIKHDDDPVNDSTEYADTSSKLDRVTACAKSDRHDETRQNNQAR